MTQPAFSKKPLEWRARAVVQIVTIAKFKRPATPKNCNIHAYHVWGWWARPYDPWTFRPKLAGAQPDGGK